METALPPEVLAAIAVVAVVVCLVLVRSVTRGGRRRALEARSPMTTDEFVAALPQAGRDRAYRRFALAVRATLAEHSALPEESVYPTDLLSTLAAVGGGLTGTSLRRGMETHLGKTITARGSDALRPASGQTVASYIGQVARGAEIVE